MSKPERTVFQKTGKDAVNERFECLKAMHTLVIASNEESVYESWIYIVPDQCDDDELRSIAEDDPDTYACACGLFMRLMKSKAMKEGGLYIGGEVYADED